MFCASLLILEHCPKSLQDPLSTTFYAVLQLLRGSLWLLPIPAPHHPPLPFILCRSFSNHYLSNLRVLCMLPLPETFTPLPRFQLLFPTCPSKLLPCYPQYILGLSTYDTVVGLLTACQSLPKTGRPCVCPFPPALSCPPTHTVDAQ